MNIQFLIGFGSALLVATKEGRTILDKVTKTVGEVTESSLKLGVDVIKDTLPNTTSIFEKIKDDVQSTESESTL